MLRRVLLLSLLLVFAAPVAAGAQGSPFGPLPPAQPAAPEPEPTAPSDAGEDEGLQTWQQLLIILAGAIVVVGIGWAIISDARRRVPAVDSTDGRQQARSQREVDRKRGKEKARAAARRSRQARRKNR